MSNGEGAAPQKKKGLGPLAWVAIGCGALIVVVMVVFAAGGWFVFSKAKDMASEFQENPARAAAEMAVKLNPDLELVESDEAEGTLTVRQKSTGETMTFDYDEIAEGRFSFTDEEGEEVSVDFEQQGDKAGMVVSGSDGTRATFGAGGPLPGWLPAGPPESEGARSTMQVTQGGTTSGSAMATSDASIDELTAYYDRALRDLGLTVQKSDFTGPQGRLVTLSGESAERTLVVNLVTGQDARTQVTLTYKGPEG